MGGGGAAPYSIIIMGRLPATSRGVPPIETSAVSWEYGAKFYPEDLSTGSEP